MNAIILLLCAVLRIASASEPGARVFITGHVFGPDGRPRANVEMRVWHADTRGIYSPTGEDSPRLRGTLRTGPDGSWAVDTIKPGLYPGATSGAHMHFLIDGHADIIFFDGPTAIHLTRDAHGILRGTHDFHLHGSGR